ncbi:glycosyltransferase [Cellulomonas sp. PhB150]|uniref:glycosyltransferase n=1 Tax=Cellulomonas sp. PhB150 TaxID=2485188 RepID=UPI000FBA8706|nr:glycosyltransferase [Cellulomonas sp. PhB150]ROS28240.1 lipopolysaccharide biosynthesis glycosyltransferase [Cellulomonas sp. PhB150]
MTGPTHDRAFVAFVDDNYFPGFVVLLKSLTLTNPDVEADVVVLHDGLSLANISRAVSLRPDLRFVRVGTERYERYTKGSAANYLYTKAYYILDAFRLTGYRRIVTLDTDMVVLDRIDDLFALDAPFAAVPQFFDSDGGRKLNSGLLAFDETYTDGTFAARLDAIGESGEYELERHDQGVITAALDGDYLHLPRRYNWVKRATRRGGVPPQDTAILHFTGKFKPWDGGEHGYARLEALWHQYDVSDAAFLTACARLAEQGQIADPTAATAYKARGAGVPETDARGPVAAQREATRLRGAGDFAGAVALLESHALEAGQLDTGYALDLAASYRAVSRYDDAAVLASTALASNRAGEAHVALAEVAWIVGDLDGAREHARSALALEPLRHKARLVHARAVRTTPDAEVVATSDPAGITLSHAAFYVDPLGNYGDVLLPAAVREAVTHVRGVADWHGVHVHQVFDEAAVDAVNATSGLLVGGGGLFLPDTSPNGNSGWQWNVPDASLDRLTVPLGLVAVGYNLFPGQEFLGSRFRESLTHVVDRAQFVGLRNRGSIERVRALLPADLADRVTYLPCPTTILGLLPGTAYTDPVEDTATRDVVYLNVAYDRSALRFKDEYPAFLAEIDAFVRGLSGVAQVRIGAHTIPDERIAVDLFREHGTRVGVDSFFRLGVEETTRLYREAALVVGMRGHAGMIPFGLGTPILSLVSHAKLRYFLEDVGRPEWGVDVAERHLGARLLELSTDVLGAQDRYRSQVADARQGLYDTSVAALRPFLEAL